MLNGNSATGFTGFSFKKNAFSRRQRKENKLHHRQSERHQDTENIKVKHTDSLPTNVIGGFYGTIELTSSTVTIFLSLLPHVFRI